MEDFVLQQQICLAEVENVGLAKLKIDAVSFFTGSLLIPSLELP